MPRRESRFFCVTDEGLPRGTTALLREACRRRNVRYAEVPASSFDYDQGRRLNPGDLLYCAAATQEARRVEQFLHARGVVTFYSGGDGIYYDCSNPELLLERAGLPTPRSLACVAADHDLLRRQADQLGGFPLVMKFPGWWKGVGVVRVDSMPSLISLVDFALARGEDPVLCEYVADATQWRVTVIGNRSVHGHRNPIRPADFRTSCSRDPADFSVRLPRKVRQTAVAAVRAFRLEFGGVDLLQDRAGRLCVLEVNFPAFFAAAQRASGVDIAGGMIEFLIAKAVRSPASRTTS